MRQPFAAMVFLALLLTGCPPKTKPSEVPRNGLMLAPPGSPSRHIAASDVGEP